MQVAQLHRGAKPNGLNALKPVLFRRIVLLAQPALSNGCRVRVLRGAAGRGTPSSSARGVTLAMAQNPGEPLAGGTGRHPACSRGPDTERTNKNEGVCEAAVEERWQV